MTGLDADSSQDIADAIVSKGGRYLEAQIQGSRVQAEEGTLIILAAGDRTLFDECQSCFEAMGKTSFFLGDVGNATKMYLVLQLYAGVTLGALAESLALGKFDWMISHTRRKLRSLFCFLQLTERDWNKKTYLKFWNLQRYHRRI